MNTIETRINGDVKFGSEDGIYFLGTYNETISLPEPYNDLPVETPITMLDFEAEGTGLYASLDTTRVYKNVMYIPSHARLKNTWTIQTLLDRVTELEQNIISIAASMNKESTIRGILKIYD